MVEFSKALKLGIGAWALGLKSLDMRTIKARAGLHNHVIPKRLKGALYDNLFRHVLSKQPESTCGKGNVMILLVAAA